nr:microtubule-associated protein 70-1-like [Tanacetum cinerariifolium]
MVNHQSLYVFLCCLCAVQIRGHKHKATLRPSLDNDDLIHLVHGFDPIKVELNRLENEVRDPVKPTR